MELQPAACTKGGCLQPVRDNINWRKMNKVGRRGFVVVMPLLTWWRVACSKAKSDQWELMVNNVAEVLEKVWKLPPITSSCKHVVSDDPVEDSRPSKRVKK